MQQQLPNERLSVRVCAGRQGQQPGTLAVFRFNTRRWCDLCSACCCCSLTQLLQGWHCVLQLLTDCAWAPAALSAVSIWRFGRVQVLTHEFRPASSRSKFTLGIADNTHVCACAWPWIGTDGVCFCA